MRRIPKDEKLRLGGQERECEYQEDRKSKHISFRQIGPQSGLVDLDTQSGSLRD